MMRKTLHLSDGSAVTALEVGSGAPVVLLHGVGMQAQAWGPQLAALGQHFHVIALNLPGHGGSTPLPADSALPDFVAWAAKAIAALNLGPVRVIGHSMGALIASGLAVEAPELVTGVALLNIVYCRDPAARRAVSARADQIRLGQNDTNQPLARWFGDSAADQIVRAEVEGWLRSVDPDAYATTYRAFADGDSIYAKRWSDVTCPVLLLTGDGDANSTPDMALAMAGSVENREVEVIEGHRHMVNLTAPAAVSQRLLTWLNRSGDRNDAR